MGLKYCVENQLNFNGNKQAVVVKTSQVLRASVWKDHVITVARNSWKSHRISRLRGSRSTDRISSVVAERNDCRSDVNASVAARLPVFVLSRFVLYRDTRSSSYTQTQTSDVKTITGLTSEQLTMLDDDIVSYSKRSETIRLLSNWPV